MSKYYPDYWVPVLLETPEHGKIYKVFAGWAGGYTSGASWKLSSGIESVSKQEGRFVIPQSSGSVYIVPENTHMSLHMESILSGWKKQLNDESDVIDTRISIISLEDLLEAFNFKRNKDD